MSEEVKNAGLIVSRAMVTSFVINGLMGLIMLMTLMFCMPNVLSALQDFTTYPFLYVLRSSMFTEAVNGITLIVLLLITAGSIDGTASASRQAWALARDRSLPFSQWIAHVGQYS